MNIDSYTFMGHWILLEYIKPINAQRVLFTDGDSIVIGSLTIQENVVNWLFDREDLKGYKPIAWMELPSLDVIKKCEIFNEQDNLGV